MSQIVMTLLSWYWFVMVPLLAIFVFKVHEKGAIERIDIRLRRAFILVSALTLVVPLIASLSSLGRF